MLHDLDPIWNLKIKKVKPTQKQNKMAVTKVGRRVEKNSKMLTKGYKFEVIR